MTFDREMQRALMEDAQKLRDMGVECDDPFFFSTEEDECEEPPAAERPEGENNGKD